MWNHPTRASIYVNFIRVPPAKTYLHSLTKFHSPLLILSCPNQFVPEKCGFLYLSKVSVLHLCRIHSAVRCRCAQIAISKQCGNHARQYPTWNSWTHYLVVWPWAVSECDIEEHKSVARCLGDWMIFPKATWALVEDDHTRGRPSLIRIMRTNMFISSSKIGVELIRWTERCVSAHIVQRHLVAAGYHSRSPARCPKHTHDQHCQSRIWAPRYQKWNHQHWSLVIFADESMFWLYNCDGRAHIRQPHGERLVDCCIQKMGEISAPPSWYGVLSMHQVNRSWWWWMGRSTSNTTLASKNVLPWAKATFQKNFACTCQCHTSYCTKHMQFSSGWRGWGHAVACSELAAQSPVAMLQEAPLQAWAQWPLKGWRSLYGTCLDDRGPWWLQGEVMSNSSLTIKRPDQLQCSMIISIQFSLQFVKYDQIISETPPYSILSKSVIFHSHRFCTVTTLKCSPLFFFRKATFLSFLVLGNHPNSKILIHNYTFISEVILILCIVAVIR